MTRKVAKPRAIAKQAPAENRNQKPGNRNPICPVMQKVKDLLKGTNAVWELHCLTAIPVGTVQKLLSGDRQPTTEHEHLMLRTWMGRELMMVILDGCTEDWIVRYRRQLDVNEARRQLIANQRAIDALQTEII
jgi:hypothetical protein